MGQAEEQVPADGGHFERSPMYHLHVMDDLLCLAHCWKMTLPDKQMRSVWQRMAACLAWMQHPDGNIPLLNDAASTDRARPRNVLQGASLGLS